MDRICFQITGLECTASTRVAIERKLMGLPGVTEAYVNPATETVYVDVERNRFSHDDAVAVLESFGARVVCSWVGPWSAHAVPRGPV